jgi:hypothetical protein
MRDILFDTFLSATKFGSRLQYFGLGTNGDFSKKSVKFLTLTMDQSWYHHWCSSKEILVI